MKKRGLILSLCLLASALLISALAAGGDASDPLISLSYLNTSYTSTVETAISKRLDASDQTILSSAGSGTTPSSGTVSTSGSWQEIRLKSGDQLLGTTGLFVMPLAGKVQASFSTGTVVDVTTGSPIASGAVLTANHRYLVAEDTSAVFTVSSPTAVVEHQGSNSLSYSDSVDYNAMATALKQMRLFKGSFTAYGDGYDLEVAPTRLQALIMFIRVLGEENAALSWSVSLPFKDLTPGSDAAKYVGYAYEHGYTNGYTATAWKPAQTVNVYQYTEFMLRALGYSSTANTNLADTMERAVACNLLTSVEAAGLKTQTFLRAQLVYISFRSLDATLSGQTATLQEALISKGIFTAAEADAAQAEVSTARIF